MGWMVGVVYVSLPFSMKETDRQTAALEHKGQMSALESKAQTTLRKPKIVKNHHKYLYKGGNTFLSGCAHHVLPADWLMPETLVPPPSTQ